MNYDFFRFWVTLSKVRFMSSLCYCDCWCLCYLPTVSSQRQHLPVTINTEERNNKTRANRKTKTLSVKLWRKSFSLFMFFLNKGHRLWATFQHDHRYRSNSYFNLCQCNDCQNGYMEVRGVLYNVTCMQMCLDCVAPDEDLFTYKHECEPATETEYGWYHIWN